MRLITDLLDLAVRGMDTLECLDSLEGFMDLVFKVDGLDNRDGPMLVYPTDGFVKVSLEVRVIRYSFFNYFRRFTLMLRRSKNGC